jgi:hypothetical protein
MPARQGNQESATQREWLRGMFEDGRHVGPSANVPDLRPRRVLRFPKNKHATKHFHRSKHPIVQSIEPGENWRWCYVDEIMLD